MESNAVHAAGAGQRRILLESESLLHVLRPFCMSAMVALEGMLGSEEEQVRFSFRGRGGSPGKGAGRRSCVRVYSSFNHSAQHRQGFPSRPRGVSPAEKGR